MKVIKDLKKRGIRLSEYASLGTKINLVFGLFLVLPLLLFTAVSYSLTNQLILKQTISTMSYAYNEAVSVFDSYFNNMAEAMRNILSNEEVYGLATGSAEGNTVFQQQAYYHALLRRSNYIKQISAIDYIRLYVKSDHLYILNDKDIFSLNAAEQSDWYQQLQVGRNSRHWVMPGYIQEPDGSDSRFFSYLGVIYGPEILEEPLGMLRIDIDKEKIEEILHRVQFNSEASVFLTDGKSKLYGLNQNGEELSLENLKKFLNGGSDWKFMSYNGERYIVRSEGLQRSDWHLVAMVPQSSIFQAQQILYLVLLIGLFCIALVSYGLAYSTINSSLKRIFILNKEMKRVESGDLSHKITPAGSDEIGELMKSFRAMTLRMEEMIDEKYRMGQEVKNAELNALQAQINPHFLYNSLDLVNCLAIQHDVPEIAEMINSLVDFYKLSLNRGKEILSLEDELRHVQAYVRIQNMRFEKGIRLIVEEAPWHREYSILKIILQPLVENSIMHGILEKEQSSGEIRIETELKEGNIYLTVRDDGVGMSEKQIEHLWKGGGKSRHNTSGYGVKNINERLALYYGINYGLSFESQEGKGTTVTICIPAVPFESS